jgi:membrane protease YdiL (CAAX protease family)
MTTKVIVPEGGTKSSLFMRHPLAVYWVLACAFSWLVTIPLALSAQGIITPLPYELHYLSAYGPLLAAVVVTALTAGMEGLRNLGQHYAINRVRLGWLVLCAFLPIGLFGLAVVVAWLINGAWPDVLAIGQVNFLPDLGLAAWLMWIVTSGIGEETGWRGFALPRLQARHNALIATLLLWLVWALWHLPSFFYLPSYKSIGLAGFPGFAFSLLAGATLFTWLYNSSRGSLLAVALFHGGFNFVTASPASTGTVAMIIGIGVTIVALLVVAVYKPTNLARPERQQYQAIKIKVDYNE